MVPIPTRWCVITGAPCAGKTSVIKALGQLGYKYSAEPAAAYIESLCAKGLTLEQIKNDFANFQKSLFEFYKNIELGLNPNDLVFRDRAMPDAITYSRMAKLDLDEAIEHAKRFRYQHVFLLDPLPYDVEGVRIEDDAVAAYLDKQLEIEYRHLGYAVIRVPVMPVEERVRFILESVKLETITMYTPDSKPQQILAIADDCFTKRRRR